MAERRKFRTREVVLAVAAGVVAAGGAALTLDALKDDGPIVAITGPREMTYEVAPFQQVATVGPQDVVITYGDGFAVRSEGSPDAIARLEAVVENGTLTIRPKDGWNGVFGRGDSSSATFYVTLPLLEGVSLAGSGDVSVDRVEGSRFEAEIAGSGELSIDDLRVDRAEFSIAGHGDIVAAGSVGETHVSILGSGGVQGDDLVSRTADVSVAGSGDVSLNVESAANVSMVGSGDVDISGPARCSISRLGSGDVTCNGGE